MRRIAFWAVVVLVVFFVITNPSGASHMVTGIGHWLYGVGQAITTFFSNISP